MSSSLDGRRRRSRRQAPAKPHDAFRAPWILIQKDDYKARSWSSAARNLGTQIHPAPGSPIAIPLWILRSMAGRQPPAAVVLRYLNSYPSLARSLLRFASELATLGLSRLLGIRVVWICHNVDRESAGLHPRLTALRRRVVARVASRILVTDRLLLPHARRAFPDAAEKIDYTSFGAPLGDDTHADASDVTEGVLEFAREVRSRVQAGARALIGFYLGSPADKVVHFGSIRPLISRAADLGVDLHLVILGPLDEFLRQRYPAVLDYMSRSPRVFYRGVRVRIDEARVAPHVDFYWRGYADYSVPLSLYGAAAMRRPMLALDVGFLGEAVAQYALGAVVACDLSNLGNALRQLEAWQAGGADQFLATHSWEVGAARLLHACGRPGGEHREEAAPAAVPRESRGGDDPSPD